MSTSFPVAIDTLTNPAATDGLAGHAQQHANANDAIEALQAKVGVTGSANPESIDYRVASVESGKVDKAAGKQLSTEDYSTVEKQKLAGIEAGANAYTHPATHSAAMVDTDSTHRFVTDTQAAAWDSKAAGSHVGSGGTAHAAVTTSVDGFMSAPDKVKLNAISGTNTGDETATTIKAKLGIATLSGVNTGDQTSVTGNAGTATKLQTARTINGVSFDGGANITINAVDSTARIALSEKGAANGVAPLGVDSKIAASYLPSYVDDVLEYANQAAFPASGETGKIYVALDSNKPFRWSGSAYVYITSGAVDSVAGKTGVVTLAKGDVGLGNVDNTSDASKPVSTAQQTALDLKANATSSITSGTLTHSGDVVLSGTGKRITGDFSNATIANRVMFQTSTVNANTNISAIPNGTATTSLVKTYNSSDPTNSAEGLFGVLPTDMRLAANKQGSGTYLPMTFFTGGAERMRIATTGDVLVTSPAGLGYGTGAGGTVTQATSKSTSVALNKPCGQISINNSALGAGEVVGFVLNNSTISGGDTISLTQVQNGIANPSSYYFWSFISNHGTAVIFIKNISDGSLSDPIELNFQVHKGANS